MIFRRLAGIFLLLTFTAGCSSDPAGETPDFDLPAMGADSDRIHLAQLNRNDPVLLIFWATWCPACLKEIPVLNEWHSRYQARGLRIVAVNVQESRGLVGEFMQTQGIDYPVALDLEGETASRFGIVGLPATVLLAKGGEILYYGFSLPVSVESYLK